MKLLSFFAKFHDRTRWNGESFLIESTNKTTPKRGEGVGALLRASRNRCGEKLPRVAEMLCIRLCYLEAIEEGRFAELPGPAYALGFVRTYANHLGLDGDEVIRRLRAENEIVVAKSELTFPVPLSDSSVPSGAVVMIGLVAATVAYGAYLVGTSRDGGQVARVSPVPEHLMRDTARQGAPPPAATAAGLTASESVKNEYPAMGASSAMASASIATVIVPPSASSFGATSVPVPAQVAVAVPTQPAVPPTPPAQTSRIEVRAKADSWIQVRDGGAGDFLLTRLLREGETFAVPVRAGLVLLTSNAGALEFRVDGEIVPTLGADGAARRSIALDVERLKQGIAASE